MMVHKETICPKIFTQKVAEGSLRRLEALKSIAYKRAGNFQISEGNLLIPEKIAEIIGEKTTQDIINNPQLLLNLIKQAENDLKIKRGRARAVSKKSYK